LTDIVQQLVNALALGGTYALLALGIAIVFNVLGVINFAHGELITLTGFTLLVLQDAGIGIAVAIPASVACAGVCALLMERVAFRPVRGSPQVTTLLTSFALAVIIQNALTIHFGARPKGVGFPEWMSSNLAIGTVDIQVLQLVTLVVTALALAALVAGLRYTATGVALRAAAEDFDVTRLMGVRANRVIAAAFLASGIMAGIVGVLWVARRGVVDPLMGLSPVLKAFIAAVLGGLGSLPGAVAAGFLLGAVEVTFQATLPGSALPFTDALAFAAVVAILLWRPEGVLVRKREVVA
jgi:branched-chain amino acid transport system permease protein